MADVTLVAEKRTDHGSRPAGRLRRDGKLPAVVYGLASETVPITVPTRELAHLLAGDRGANTLITLKLDGEELLTLARQIQRHPARGDLLHVDFIRIRRDVAVHAEVPIHLTGEAAGARDGGVLEQLVFSLTVEAKPADIPTGIEADISGLEVGGQVRIADLGLPSGVVALQDPDELVALVAVPRGVAAGEEEAAEEGEEGAEAGEGGEGAAEPGSAEGEASAGEG